MTQVFNRILAPYVENLDMNQVNYGIAQGRFSLIVHILQKQLYFICRSVNLAEFATKEGRSG